MGIISIVIACLALIVSVAVFVRDNHRYRIPLQMRIPTTWVVWTKDNQTLALFRLILVNHSVTGRTVATVQVSKRAGITAKPIAWIYDEDYRNATALLPSLEKSNPLPIHEVLHETLDIPPHQSQCKWAGFLVQLPPKGDREIEESHLPIHIAAFDINDKMLAIVQIDMTLSELRNVGVYLKSNAVIDVDKVREDKS